jgi:3-methyladenine DNA glycosylase AlkC
MSLWWKINRVIPKEEKELLQKMLNKCLNIRFLWCKALSDNNRTDQQCNFAYNKLMKAEQELYTRFAYLHMDNFNLDDIKMCIE